jgi:hypothetical protein
MLKGHRPCGSQSWVVTTETFEFKLGLLDGTYLGLLDGTYLIGSGHLAGARGNVGCCLAAVPVPG